MPSFWPKNVAFVPGKKIGTTGFSLKADEMYAVIDRALAFGYATAGDALRDAFRAKWDGDLVRCRWMADK